MSLKQLKREMGLTRFSIQGGRPYEIDLHVMEGLAEAHRRKLRGEIEPLDRDRSVYNPTRPGVFDRRKPKSTKPKTTRRNPAGPPWKS